jgi:hypothetical protein
MMQRAESLQAKEFEDGDEEVAEEDDDDESVVQDLDLNFDHYEEEDDHDADDMGRDSMRSIDQLDDEDPAQVNDGDDYNERDSESDSDSNHSDIFGPRRSRPESIVQDEHAEIHDAEADIPSETGLEKSASVDHDSHEFELALQQHIQRHLSQQQIHTENASHDPELAPVVSIVAQEAGTDAHLNIQHSEHSDVFNGMIFTCSGKLISCTDTQHTSLAQNAPFTDDAVQAEALHSSANQPAETDTPVDQPTEQHPSAESQPSTTEAPYVTESTADINVDSKDHPADST